MAKNSGVRMETSFLLFMVAVGGVLCLALLWISQFVQLMLLEDRDFPGKWDKLIWAAAFVMLPPVGAVAFYVWKRAYLVARAPNVTRGANVSAAAG